MPGLAAASVFLSVSALCLREEKNPETVILTCSLRKAFFFVLLKGGKKKGGGGGGGGVHLRETIEKE